MFHVLDEATGEWVYRTDNEAFANAAANRQTRETCHDASVWIDGSEGRTRTGYYVDAAEKRV